MFYRITSRNGNRASFLVKAIEVTEKKIRGPYRMTSHRGRKVPYNTTRSIGFFDLDFYNAKLLKKKFDKFIK